MLGGSEGGNVGLMGEISRTVWEGLGKGSVVGVIPEVLQPREVHCDLPTQLQAPLMCVLR